MKKPVLSMEENVIQVLVVRAQEGDTEAFAKLYDHFFLPIYRYTAFRAPREMVEDLVADVFVKSWEKLHTYKMRRGVPFGRGCFASPGTQSSTRTGRSGISTKFPKSSPIRIF